MKFKKQDIKEMVNKKNQLKNDSKDLSKEDATASMISPNSTDTVFENDGDVADRAIAYGVQEPEVGSTSYEKLAKTLRDLADKKNKGKRPTPKSSTKSELPFEEGMNVNKSGDLDDDNRDEVGDYVDRMRDYDELPAPKYSQGDYVIMDMGDGSKEKLTITKVSMMKPPKGKFTYLYRTKEYPGNMAFTEDMVLKLISNLNENSSKRRIIKTIKVKDL